MRHIDLTLMLHLTTTIMPVLGFLDSFLPSAAIDVVGDVVVFSVAVGIPNVFLTRTHSESRNSEGDGASLARNTDYGDGAMMTTAKEREGREGRNNAKFELGRRRAESCNLNFLQMNTRRLCPH